MSAIFLGIPAWWALGLIAAVPIVMSAVMARDLYRRRDRVVLPAGFTVWALFLAWVAFGVFVLWADAPSAVPGGGPSRLMVFGLRGAWYLAGTVALLWTMNRTEDELPTWWVFELVASLFVITTAGGLLGLLAPNFEFRSLAEFLLPGGLRSNALVSSLIHPAAAEIQSVLGSPAPRPQAPFAFANTWGSVMGLTMPFFLVAWLKNGRPWQRVLAPVVLFAAAFPIVYSLNRGLWVCLAMGGVGLILLQLGKRRVAPFIATVTTLLVLGIALAASPLGDVYQQRLDNQHSNDRRSELLIETVTSAATGSPVVGFGSTRDVQGNFTSIAGGSTAECPSCGVPSLGTQGQLWLIIFSQGLVGTMLFALFFGRAVLTSWRCRTQSETICTFVLAFYAWQIWVYDTSNLPFLIVMLAVALVAREQSGRAWPAPRRAMDAWGRLRQVGPFVALLVLGGAALGGAWSMTRPSAYTASVSVLLEQVPVELDSAAIDPYVERSKKSTDITVDTEAALVTSGQTLAMVERAVGGQSDLGDRITVTAPPNSRVLTITATAARSDQASEMARDVSNAYLTRRRRDLAARRTEALTEAERQVAVLLRGADYARGGQSEVSPATLAARALLEDLQNKIGALTLTPVDSGAIINSRPAKRMRSQGEVPIASGAALGLGLGVLIAVCRPGWSPRLARRRRRTAVARIRRSRLTSDHA